MNGIELDQSEMTAVMLLLSASRVFGIADVVPAEPAARDEAFVAGLTRLRARGLVTGKAPEQAIPDTGLMRLVSVVVDPRLVVVAERATGGDASLHFADDRGYVSLEGNATSGYRLGWVDDTALLARRVLRFLEIEPTVVATGSVFSLPEAAFSGARELARAADQAAAEAALIDAGLQPAQSAAAAAALTPAAGGHVLIIRLNAGRAEAARRAWVLAAQGGVGWVGWRPVPDDSQLRFEPLSAIQLAQVIDRFAELLSPVRA